MTNTLTRESLEAMSAVERLSGVKVVDLVEDGDNMVFVIADGQIGRAIGKNGSTLLRLKEALKPKNVEVIEDALDFRAMIDKTLRGIEIRNVTNEDNKVAIFVDPLKRGVAIGKGGANIKKLKLALKRKFGIEDTRIV